MPYLVGTIEDWTRTLDNARVAGLEARRGHTSCVRRLRATGLADSIGRNAIEAEGREQVRTRNQRSLIDRVANRGGVERRAQAAVDSSLNHGTQAVPFDDSANRSAHEIPHTAFCLHQRHRDHGQYE